MTLGSVRITPSDHDEPQPPGRGATGLDRLLVAATLTPAQAAVIAADVLMLSADQPGTRATSLPASAVTLHDDGTLTVTREGKAAALLAELASNADRPAARRGPQADLLTALPRARDALRSSGTTAAQQVLADALIDVDLAETRRELRRLVQALHALPAAPVDRPFLPVAPPPPSGPPALGPLPLPRSRLRMRRPVLAAAIALIVVAGAVAGAVWYTQRPAAPADRPAAQQQQPLEPARQQPVASKPPVAKPAQPGLRALAPAAAGSVNGVTIAPQGSCPAGAACTATITLALRPHGYTSFDWRLVAMTCSGTTTSLERGTMFADPSWTKPYATVSFQAPDTKGRIVAEVTSPVHAASPPLPLGAGC